MLVLSRQRDQTIDGDGFEVTVVDIRGDKVRLGLTAVSRPMTEILIGDGEVFRIPQEGAIALSSRDAKLAEIHRREVFANVRTDRVQAAAELIRLLKTDPQSRHIPELRKQLGRPWTRGRAAKELLYAHGLCEDAAGINLDQHGLKPFLLADVRTLANSLLT